MEDQQLPKVSNQEDLEQLSRNKFQLIFPIKKFVLRNELERDKGIDFIGELKNDNGYLNFRFNVQLKATSTKTPNSDGSYSWSIDTSNIEYLINGGIPAYYFVYVESEDKFFYSNLNEFVHDLIKKNEEWNKQLTHTLRTSKEVTQEAIDLIYNEVLERSNFIKGLNNLFLLDPESTDKKIGIDSALNITDETQIVKIIEETGFNAIREGRSQDIINFGLKVAPNVTTALFNLILGIANHYTSKSFEALSYFESAETNKENLSKDHIDLLLYFSLLVKYSIGFIDDEEYNKLLEPLNESKELKYYIEIEKIKSDFFYSGNIGDFEFFKSRMLNIAESTNKDVPIHIRNTAKCEYLLYWGHWISMDYSSSIYNLIYIELLYEVDQKRREQNAFHFFERKKEWSNYRDSLIAYFKTSKSNEGFLFICRLYSIQISVEMCVNICVSQLEPDNPTNSPSSFNYIEEFLSQLDEIANYFESVNHSGYLIHSLITKYEILEFLDKPDEMLNVINTINHIVNERKLREQKTKFQEILKNGTHYKRLQTHYDEVVNSSRLDQIEYTKIIESIEDIDEKDLAELSTEQSNVIHLFPMEYFRVPVSKRNEFFNTLNIDSRKLVNQLENMWDQFEVIPVLNLFNELVSEGYCNGMYDDKGIESWQKIHSIRKTLFEKGFSKVLLDI